MELAERSTRARAESRPAALLVLAAWVGFNLRGAVLGVPPLLDRIGSALSLSHAAQGLLVALPVLCFGVAAIPGARTVRRLGAHRTVTAGLVMVVLGTLGRSLPLGPAGGVVLLFAGTLVLSAGIGIAQPALPRVLREVVPAAAQRASVMVTLGFIMGQLVAAAATLPVLLPLFRDWRLVLAFWAVPAAVALLWWLRAAGDGGGVADGGEADETAGALTPLLRSRQLWMVAAIMACSNLTFFTANAWLPASAPGGAEGGAAEVDLIVLNAASLPVIALLSSLRRPFVRTRGVYVLAGALTAAGATGWLVAPELGPLWVGLAGGASTLAFSAVVTFPATLRDPARIAPFSALVWTVGCTGAFLGPLLGGVGIDALHWARAPFVPIAAAGLVMLACAIALPLHEG